jgi:phospholipid transport system substrate-binding protein
MMKRRLFAGLLALAALVPLPGAAQGVPAPAAPIAALNAGLVEIMQAGKAVPFAKRMAILTPIVQKSFDLDLLLRNSVGPARWAAISDPQKAELKDVFTQFTVASYVANFDAFAGEKFVIAPDQRPTGNDKVVQTKILGTGGDTTRIDYVMREESGAWRVVDVLLDGSISRVAVTRSDFRSLLSQSDASPLIVSLRGKVANLSSGNAS